eukprot:Skav214475  [mRNA]  locus=scaffold1167:203907:222052:+ [translate_table: standard]
MIAFLIHFHRKKGQLLFVDSGSVSSTGKRIFGRPKLQGLLDLDKEGTLIFNNVHRINKQLRPEVAQLANNGTYWSRTFNETRKSRLKILLIAEDQFPELASISGARIKVPALRVRRADIESIVKYQLRILARTYRKKVPYVEPEALKRLQAYDLTRAPCAAVAVRLLPGVVVYAADLVMRQLCNLLVPDRKPPNEFLQLAYSYLPLTWLASLAHYLQLGLVEAGQVLRSQSLLFSLDLCCNEISDVGATALLEALEENHVLLEPGTPTTQEGPFLGPHHGGSWWVMAVS